MRRRMRSGEASRMSRDVRDIQWDEKSIVCIFSEGVRIGVYFCIGILRNFGYTATS
jgi:hypothetical protein